MIYTIPKHTGRWIMGVAYLSFTTAGVFSFMNPSNLLVNAGLAQYARYVWAGFLLFGGLLCLVTTVTDLWLGEYLGLILLTTTFITYALATAVVLLFGTGYNPGLATFLGLSIGWSGLAIVRWQQVSIIKKQGRRIANSTKDNRGD